MFNLRFQEFMGFLLGPENRDERVGGCYPALDVYENSQELCIEMEIPGIRPEDVNVEVIGKTLRVSGVKTDPLSTRNVRYKRMERSFGRFNRELEIPNRFDLEKIEARFLDGVLVIRIRRQESKVEMVRRITIE